MSDAVTQTPMFPLPDDCREAAAVLNRGCACLSVDHAVLQQALERTEVSEVQHENLHADQAVGDGARSEVLSEGLPEALPEVLSYEALSKTHPNLFSDTSVFVAETHLLRMAELIAAIERVVALPAWDERVFAHAPEIARYSPKARGVFLGYDFHLGEDGPRLIEINTNAGGALLNAKLLRAQKICCAPLAKLHDVKDLALEESFFAMFLAEWALSQATRVHKKPLTRIAIVDDAPKTQFLAPEFELFRRLFMSKGLEALIIDPSELAFDGEALSYRGLHIDLVYNRLTDFSLQAAEHAVLRSAYLADAVVVTPHPQAHARYADKRNLVALTDMDWLREIGVSAADREALHEGVPRTEIVLPHQAERFWAERKQWFFKPMSGFGGKGAYRGEKITKRVFEEISQGTHVAQALVPPSKRRLWVDGAEQDLKLDLRNYVYQAQVQFVSARLYQGQTTNFRTPGGGFAAVFAVPCQGDVQGCVPAEKI